MKTKLQNTDTFFCTDYTFINESNKSLCPAKDDLKLPPKILICLYNIHNIQTPVKICLWFVLLDLTSALHQTPQLNTVLAVVIQKERKEQEEHLTAGLTSKPGDVLTHTGGGTGESRVSLKGLQSKPAKKAKVKQFTISVVKMQCSLTHLTLEGQNVTL